MKRSVLFAVVLAACGAAGDGGEPDRFREARIRVGPAPVSVLVLDVDRDGHRDVVASGRLGVAVLLGDGTGTLRPEATVSAGERPQGLAAADFDEDGWPDLAVANHETDYVTVLFGGPDGFSDARQRRIPVETDPHPHEVRTTDVDADGHADLLVDDRTAGLLRVFRGRGDGSFAGAEPVDVGGDPYVRIAVADLDGDGRNDLATPNPRAVAVHFGDGEGGFTPGPRLRAPGLRPFSAAAGEVNGDGIQDLLAGHSQEGGRDGLFVVWLGSAVHRWSSRERRSYVVGGGPSEVALADVDGDGLDDALVTSYAAGELAVLLTGDRTGNRAGEPIRLAVSDNPWGVAAGDLDGDGRAEVVTADNGGDEISVFFYRGG